MGLKRDPMYDAILMKFSGGTNERKSAGSSSIYSHDSETPFIKRSISQDTEMGQVNGGPRYRSGSRTTEKPNSRIMGKYNPSITDRMWSLHPPPPHPNEFHWIQQIHCLKTKSKCGMVTRGITYPVTDTLPMVVIQDAFSLLHLGRYLLPLTTANRYQPADSNGNFFSVTTWRNVSIVRYVSGNHTTLGFYLHSVKAI